MTAVEEQVEPHTITANYEQQRARKVPCGRCRDEVTWTADAEPAIQHVVDIEGDDQWQDDRPTAVWSADRSHIVVFAPR